MRTLTNVLVPVDDGVSLAATAYLPERSAPAPVLVSLNPYRKDDIAGAFSDGWCWYFARRGYAHVVVDTRGTGSSGGVCNDTFHPQEARDGAAVVEWAAAQPWSNGSVGLWGMSYGGAMALAVAAQRPPHLDAIVSVYGYADYYLDSAFPGGCPNCLGKFAREAWMLALELAPPSHQDVAGRWREVWRERLHRLDRDGIYSMRWRDHLDRDEYWRSRAIAVEVIEVPALVVGGWRDLFPEGMVRVYERLRGPKQLLMGPWLHVSPDQTPVEPVDWLSLLASWWDRWLKHPEPSGGGGDTGPGVTLYVQGAGWRSSDQWPLAGTERQQLFLGAGGSLRLAAGDSGVDAYVADPRVGTAAGLWDPLGVGAGYPLDQGVDDLASLTYTGAPLAEDLDIVGSPLAVIVAALEEGGDANLVAKLVDVAPDGHAALITTGWLRAAHHAGHDAAERLAPGRPYEFEIQLWATAYRVAAGHRLRLTLACADFPRIWPTADNPRLQIRRGGDMPSWLDLPVAPPHDAWIEPPRPRAQADGPAAWDIDGAADWRITENVIGARRSVVLAGRQELRLPSGSRFSVEHSAEATVARDRPDAAHIRASSSIQTDLASGELVEVTTESCFFRTWMACSGAVTVDGIDLYRGTWTNQ